MSWDKALRAAEGEHHAPGKLDCPVSTLALNLEVQLAKTLFLLEIVPGLFLNALSKPAAQPPLVFFESAFSTAQKLRATDLVTVLVGVEVLQPQVKANHGAGVLALFPALKVKAELGVVPTCPPDNPHPVDFGAEDEFPGLPVAVQGKGASLVAVGVRVSGP
jgi:hypothetical protein